MFRLQFPIPTEAVNTIAIPEQEQKKEKSLRILAVDDDETILNILYQFLSRDGHKIKTVGNGADAIKMVESEDFDLVLCDLAMPNVFGYDVVNALNKLEKRSKIGIITGWGERLKPIEEEGMKVDFIIKKPFDLSELSKHIKDTFGADSR